MALYTVHVPDHISGLVERADRTVFVREGFSFRGFVFGWLFLAWHRLWLALVAWLVLAGVIAAGWWVLQLPPIALVVMAVLMHVFVGVEGNDLRRWRLARRRFRFADIVSGERRDEAEYAFFFRQPNDPPQRPRGRIAAFRAARPDPGRDRDVSRRGSGVSVAVIDYGSGNLHSAHKAFERAQRESEASETIEVTADPDRVRAADRVVLPGVGAFGDCMAGLKAVPGMLEAMTEAVQQRGRPFLGICVGMQLMATRGLEHEETAGLGWIGGDVALITPDAPSLKIPHMGWNTVDQHGPHPLLAGIPTGDTGLHAYFVHSFHLAAADVSDVVATARYGGPVTAMVARGNMAGTQFHPEKSQAFGLALIANFLRWAP